MTQSAKKKKKLFQIVGFYGYQCYLDVYANNKEEVWDAIHDEKIDAGTLCRKEKWGDDEWKWCNVEEIEEKDMVLSEAADLDTY